MYYILNPKVLRYSTNTSRLKFPYKPLYISKKIKSKRKPLIKSSLSNIYIAKKPLHGWEPIESIMGPYFPTFFAMHCMVVIQEENSNEVIIADFLPEAPDAIETILTIITFQDVQGVMRIKHSNEMINRRWYVGKCTYPDVLDKIKNFNKSYDSKLSLLKNDCRTYTNALIQTLTGKSDTLRNLGL